jgi:putative transposase
MILTYKIKHSRDFSEELGKARQIAEFAIEHHTLSSKDVKHIGLKSVIANQILRKYSRDRKAKKITKVKLSIPAQGIRFSHEKREITVPCLNLAMNYFFRNDFEKINRIEIDNMYAYISVTIPDEVMTEPKGYLGIDRNTTEHIAVVANPLNGKVLKLGKKAEYIHKKYKNMRRKLQKNEKYKEVKKTKKREKNIERDLNHRISKRIVQEAKNNGMGIKLEYLRGIRTAGSSRNFRYSLNSWSFYQLERMIEYKARLLGVPVVYVDPYHTSKECSRCGLIGNRSGKSFKCQCGHVDHADVNASFNIALRPVFEKDIDRLHADRDVCKGNTDIPKEATL